MYKKQATTFCYHDKKYTDLQKLGSTPSDGSRWPKLVSSFTYIEVYEIMPIENSRYQNDRAAQKK
jgi:hypothetical protein